MMHGREKSDSAIVVPGKPTNKAVSTAAEPVERSGPEGKARAGRRTGQTLSQAGAGAHTVSRH